MDATDSHRYTVVLVDDSEPYRFGMARAIRRHDELDLIGEFDGGVAGLAAVQDLEPDVLVLDFRMPDLDGIAVCDRVRSSSRRLRTKALLISADIDETTQGSRAGIRRVVRHVQSLLTQGHLRRRRTARAWK